MRFRGGPSAITTQLSSDSVSSLACRTSSSKSLSIYLSLYPLILRVILWILQFLNFFQLRSSVSSPRWLRHLTGQLLFHLPEKLAQSCWLQWEQAQQFCGHGNYPAFPTIRRFTSLLDPQYSTALSWAFIATWKWTQNKMKFCLSRWIPHQGCCTHPSLHLASSWLVRCRALSRNDPCLHHGPNSRGSPVHGVNQWVNLP
jgi:hypothetical protein